MSEPQYKRVLLKLSGEALAGEASRGLDFDVIGSVCDVIKKCVACGVQIGIVVGGGNFWRGVKDGGDRMERHGRAVHPLQSHPAHGEGPGRDLWLRHRQPVFLH